MRIIFTAIEDSKLDQYYRFACKEMLTLAQSLNQDDNNNYQGAMTETSETTFISPKTNHTNTIASRMSIAVHNVIDPHNIKSVFAATIRPMHDGKLMLMITHQRNTQLSKKDKKLQDRLIQMIKKQVPQDKLQIKLK